jgi:hypothetical protein
MAATQAHFFTDNHLARLSNLVFLPTVNMGFLLSSAVRVYLNRVDEGVTQLLVV